jgi:beta-glucosidase
MQRALLLVAILLAAAPMAPARAGADAAAPYRDSRLPVETRVQDLLACMTPEEKLWQLFMVSAPDYDPRDFADGAYGLQIGVAATAADARAQIDSLQRHFSADTRLGIPMLPFAEALHGLVQAEATVFPQAIGLAASFDTALMSEVAAAIADECRSVGIRQVLSPVVNIASDVRWGRVEETYGEDPHLSAAMGVAFVAALEARGVVATPKHFIANVGDGGRDSYPIHLSERLLREIHLPPFAACLGEGGARAVMTAYNSLDGTPCSAHPWLNRTLLREELGFAGVVVSDAGAVGGANVLHYTASDYAEAGRLALDGGLDLIFQTSPAHFALFSPALADGRIAPALLDSAVARVLRLKFALGLFDDPLAGAAPLGAAQLDEHRRLARRAAQESFVLLKNEGNTLPLSEQLGSLAVLGPDAAVARLGGYSGPGERAVSILEGIRRRLGADRVRYAEGCPRLAPEYEAIASPWLSCPGGDSLSAGLRGEYFANIELAGAPAFTRIDPDVQFHWTLLSPNPALLAADFYSVRWTGRLRGPATGSCRIGVEGNDGYRLYIDEALVIDNWAKVSRRAQLVDFAFVQDRAYALRLEFYEPVGGGRVRLVWDCGLPRRADDDAELDAAVALAVRSEAAVIVAGIEEGEFRDRARLALPGRQEELIQRVAATGRPVVVLLVGGSAVTMSRWLERVPAVLAVWYPGEAGGEAVADVLFGDVNPAGRLPISFPIAEGQLPLVYNHKPTGRGDDYADLSGQPLFPFGHGLSYTQFAYSDLRLEPPAIAAGETATLTCTVRNAGPVAGEEVVQLYLRDELASVARPVTELKGFARLRLAPGEARELHFTIGPAELAMLDVKLRPVVEPGTVRVAVGASSRDLRLRGTLTVTP